MRVGRPARARRRRFRYGCTICPTIGPGPDDRDLDDEVVEACSACMRGSVAICARDSTWNTPTVSARLQHLRRPRDRLAAGDASVDRFRAAADRAWPAGPVVLISVSASCSTAIMPRPSRSTLMMPRSAQSSLSHCTTTRPGHARRARAAPPSSSRPGRRPCRRSAGRDGAAGPASAATARANCRTRGSSAAMPTSRELARDSVSSGSMYSNWLHHLREAIDLPFVESRAPCPPRAPRSCRDR